MMSPWVGGPQYVTGVVDAVHGEAKGHDQTALKLYAHRKQFSGAGRGLQESLAGMDAV